MRSLATLAVDARESGVVVATLTGEVDLSNAASIGRELAGEVPNSAQAVVLDVSGLEHLDSAGVRMVFELARRLSARGQSLRVAMPEGTLVRRVLELTRLDAVAPLDPSVEAAVERAAEAGG